MKDSAVFKVMLLLLMASVGLPASAQPTRAHDPRLDKRFLGDEWAYLKSAHGYTGLKRDGEYWYAVK